MDHLEVRFNEDLQAVKTWIEHNTGLSYEKALDEARRDEELRIALTYVQDGRL